MGQGEGGHLVFGGLTPVPNRCHLEGAQPGSLPPREAARATKMTFFRKNDPKDGAKGSAENKRVLGGDASGSMVRKVSRLAGTPAAAGTTTHPGKRFDRVVRDDIGDDLEMALEEVLASLEDDPNNDDLHMRRYEVLRRIADRTSLTKALEESAEVTGRSFYAVKLAALFEEVDDYPAALQWRQRAVEMTGEDADAIKKLAIAYVRVGDLDGAEPAFTRLLEAKKNVENPFGSSFLDDMTGRTLPAERRAQLQAMGLRLLAQALETRADNLTLLESAAHLATRANELEASINYFERLLAAHGDHANVRGWKGDLLRVFARAGMAERWRALGDGLMADYEEHLRGNRGDVRAWIAFARLQMQFGLTDQALDSLKNAIRADSREWQAVFEHGKLLIRMGRSDEAIGWYEDILSPYGSDAPEKKSVRRALERSLAELYFKLGRYNDALTIYARDEEANIRFIGPIYEAAGELERAQETYKKAVQLAPKDARAHLALAEFHVRRGDWQEVERCAAEGLRCSNAHEDVLESLYVALATAQMNQRNVAEALQTMDAAIKEAGDSPSMEFRKVKLLLLARRGKDGKSLAEAVRGALERRLSCAPSNSAYWSLLGDCCALLAQQEDAEKAYSTALRFDAQDAAAVRGLAYLSERNQDLTRALELYRRFVMLDPLSLATLPIKQKIKELEQSLGEKEPSPEASNPAASDEPE